MKRLTLCAAMVLAFGWGESPASAEQCLAQSTPPTYTAGMAVPQVCDTHGTQKVMTVDEDGNYVAGGGGGGSGGAVSPLTLASGVTTNTTSSAVAGITGTKTIWGEVVCSSGACTQTQAIYGDRDNDAANGLLLCTLTLTDTTRDQDVCTGVTADYPYLYVITTNTSGTAAAGGVYVFP